MNPKEAQAWKVSAYIYTLVMFLMLLIGIATGWLKSDKLYLDSTVAAWIAGGVFYDAFALRLISKGYQGPAFVYYLAALIMGVIAAAGVPRILRDLGLDPKAKSAPTAKPADGKPSKEFLMTWKKKD